MAVGIPTVLTDTHIVVVTTTEGVDGIDIALHEDQFDLELPSSEECVV